MWPVKQWLSLQQVKGHGIVIYKEPTSPLFPKLVPQAGIPCKKWEKSSQPSEYSRIPILHRASDLQAETEEISHKRKTNSSIKARRRNSLQKVTVHLPKVKSIPPALGSCVMLTLACQCYRRNRDFKWSPGWQELSVACTADTAAVLRSKYTNPSHGTANTRILICASNSAAEKERRSCCWGEGRKIWEIKTLLKSRT